MLKEKLLKIREESEGLKVFVLDDILDYEDESAIKDYIQSVLDYGCISGVVSSLTYYYQTKDLFSKHFEEILELVNNLKEECDIDIKLNYNDLSWLAYEETVREIASELGIY